MNISYDQMKTFAEHWQTLILWVSEVRSALYQYLADGWTDISTETQNI